MMCCLYRKLDSYLKRRSVVTFRIINFGLTIVEMLLLAGLLVLLTLHGVNSWSARSVCLNARLNDVSRRDPACANHFVRDIVE